VPCVKPSRPPPAWRPTEAARRRGQPRSDAAVRRESTAMRSAQAAPASALVQRRGAQRLRDALGEHVFRNFRNFRRGTGTAEAGPTLRTRRLGNTFPGGCESCETCERSDTARASPRPGTGWARRTFAGPLRTIAKVRSRQRGRPVVWRCAPAPCTARVAVRRRKDKIPILRAQRTQAFTTPRLVADRAWIQSHTAPEEPAGRFRNLRNFRRGPALADAGQVFRRRKGSEHVSPLLPKSWT
jgi:hypothetical protein